MISSRSHDKAFHMWTEFLHHLFLQVPITASLGLAMIGIYFVISPANNIALIIRYLGWITFIAITGTALSGIFSAPGILGGDGPIELSHHRNLGLIVWSIALLATVGFEIGARTVSEYSKYIKSASVLLWIAVAFSAIGAGHWGGAVVHSDKIPWDLSPPVIKDLK